MTKNTKKWIATGAGLAVIIAILAFYAAGYRLAMPFGISRPGVITVAVSPDMSIYVDNSKKIDFASTSQRVEYKTSPGSHSVIASRPGFYPWMKTVELQSGGTVSLDPIFVAQNPSGSIINQKDTQYQTILNAIKSNTLPTADSPILSPDQSTSVWVEQNIIIAKVDGEVHTVVHPATPIRNVSFYKNHSDALIFSDYNSVNMIEISQSGEQNFMPIYRGQSPTFAPAAEDSLYVLDENGTLMEINL